MSEPEPIEVRRLRYRLPGGVALAASWIDPPGTEAGSRAAGRPTARTQPQEQTGLIGRRLSEFTAGRRAAGDALRALGFPDPQVEVGDGGAPVWPTGSCGSITHRHPLAVAVAAAGPGSLGIDLELAAPLPFRVRERVLVPGEPSAPGITAGVAERATFSAKEAYYKWYRGLGRPGHPGFQDVRVGLESSGRLRLDPLGAVPPATGRWAIGADWILTVVWAPD